MSAVTQANPADVRLPGYSVHFAPSIATATDAQLNDCIDKDLAAIAAHIEPMQPDKEGFAPAEWHALPEHRKNNAERAIHNAETRIKVARAELERRATERQQTRQEEISNLTSRLEGVLKEGPQLVADMVKAGEAAQPSIERIRQLVSDLERFRQASLLARQYDEVADGILAASQALGKKMPELPSLPELPNDAEVRRARSIISAAEPKLAPLVDAGYKGKQAPAALAEKLNKLKH